MLLARALTGLSLAIGAVSAPVAGGWTPLDPSSPTVTNAAGVAVTYLSEQFARNYIVENITSAQSQIVSGVDYRLQMRIAQLNDDELGARKDCEAVVWKPPATASEEVTSFVCQDVSPNAPLPPAGALTPTTVSRITVQP